MALELDVGISVDLDVDRLACGHVAQLGFLEIGGHPDVIGHNRHQLRARPDIRPDIDLTINHLPRDRRDQPVVAERDIGLPHRCLPRLDHRTCGGNLAARNRDIGSGAIDLLPRRRRFCSGGTRRCPCRIKLLPGNGGRVDPA
ncbi:hypothetical protein D9M73_96440 [compost metagenome]